MHSLHHVPVRYHDALVHPFQIWLSSSSILFHHLLISLVEKRVRPTALLPVWNIAGFALGAGTALMGEKAAMACTVAVEKVIGEHYREQQNLLEDDEKELKKTIAKFEKDELEHHDIGLEHDAENAPGYKVMTKIIEIGCKAAIAISKKI